MTGTSKKTIQEDGVVGSKLLCWPLRQESQGTEGLGVRETMWPKNAADVEEARKEGASGKERHCLSPGSISPASPIECLPFH